MWGDNFSFSLSSPSLLPLFPLYFLYVVLWGRTVCRAASEEDVDALSTEPHSLIFSCLQLTQWAQTSIKVTLSVVVSLTLLLV